MNSAFDTSKSHQRAVWSIYMIRIASGGLYTGISVDPARRFAEHEHQGERCARYLRGKGPLDLVLVKAVGDQSLALRVEHRIKRLPKAAKEQLVNAHQCQDVALWNALVDKVTHQAAT